MWTVRSLSYLVEARERKSERARSLTLPLPSHFALASSFLSILSARSTIEWKYEKMEGCEQSKNDEARSTIEWKYEKMEDCEQSKNDEARLTIEWKYEKMEGCEQSKNDEVMIFPFPSSSNTNSK